MEKKAVMTYLRIYLKGIMKSMEDLSLHMLSWSQLTFITTTYEASVQQLILISICIQYV